MNINEAFPSKYLKAADLQGRAITVKMGRVDYEKIGNDERMVLYFQGKERGLVLNKTNANNIATLYGPETEDWHGQSIVLVESMVDYQGKSVPAIRVRAPRRDETKRVNGEHDPISSGPQRRPAPETSDDFPGDRQQGRGELNDDIGF